MENFRKNALRTLIASTFLLFVNLSAHAQADAPVHQFLDAFNAGDNAKALAAHSAAGVAITDEFAPFYWNGPKAFTQWAASLEGVAKANGLSEPSVKLGDVIVKTVTPTHAYLIYPAVYTYKQKGVAMRESAQMAFVVKKEGKSWKIAAWTWTGTNPQPVR